MTDQRYLPISDYAFLTDCHSTALVSRHGSIDWACLRRFDAGSTFGRILDADRGGSFSIRPVGELVTVERAYVAETMILTTTLGTDQGSIRCTDTFAMAIGGADNVGGELLRLIELVDGHVELEVIMEPRFDYGSTRPWLRRHDDGRYTAVGGDDALVIHTTMDLEIERDACRLWARVRMADDAEHSFSVLARPAHHVDTAEADCTTVRDRVDETRRWWADFSSRTTTGGGKYDALLQRSAMVLKGLTCAPTGAIVAAATTSLPEVLGGSSNWDYRYSWVRDSTLALGALAEVGHDEVAQGFRDFVMRSSAGHGDELQIMYGPYGERSLVERELDHLEGWRSSAPVRVGNGAATQTQLDVFGHLLDTAHLWHNRGTDLSDDEWLFLSSVVDEAVARRDDADSGIWELRGPPRHYVHSKVMIWVALDRGIRFVEDHGFADGSSDRWREVRDEVRHEVETRGVDPERGCFVQYYGSQAVDASLLKLALVGFVDADDERMRATTDAIIADLAVPPHGFLRRFDAGSGDDGTEGSFLLCSFWLVEVLALQGRTDEAETLFASLAGVANDVGLYSEEYRSDGNEFLGNFPQAFTHLGLIAAHARLRSARADR